MAVQFFEGPAVFDQGHREVVEEFGIGREFSLHPKVIEGGHQAFAEEGGPVSVHHHPGGEGVVSRDQPAGEAEAILGSCLVRREQGSRKAGFDHVLGLGVFAPMVAAGRARMVCRAFLHHEGGRSFDSFLKGADLVGVGFHSGGLH